MNRTVTFFLVEDDEIDILAFQRAFEKLKLANPLVIARDGVEALEMLRGLGGREPLPKPYLILLDLKMPRMSGLEFLEEIRKDPDLASAVVFVLTTSGEEQDRFAAYTKNVAGYILKGNHLQDGVYHALELVDHYWRVVELP